VLLALAVALGVAAPPGPVAAEDEDPDYCDFYTIQPTETFLHLCWQQRRTVLGNTLREQGFDPKDPKDAGMFTLLPHFLLECFDQTDYNMSSSVDPVYVLQYCQDRAIREALSQAYRLSLTDENLLNQSGYLDACLNPGIKLQPSWRELLTSCLAQRETALKEAITGMVDSLTPTDRAMGTCAVVLQERYPGLTADQLFEACVQIMNAQKLEQQCLEFLPLYGIDRFAEVCSTLAAGVVAPSSSDPGISSLTTGQAQEPRAPPPPSNLPPPANPVAAKVANPPPPPPPPPVAQGASGGAVPSWVDETISALRQSSKETSTGITEAQLQTMRNCLVQQAQQNKNRDQALGACAQVIG
jgi:hypothetical protein